jgi:hypothetical protein
MIWFPAMPCLDPAGAWPTPGDSQTSKYNSFGRPAYRPTGNIPIGGLVLWNKAIKKPGNAMSNINMTGAGRVAHPMSRVTVR